MQRIFIRFDELGNTEEREYIGAEVRAEVDSDGDLEVKVKNDQGTMTHFVFVHKPTFYEVDYNYIEKPQPVRSA